MVCISQASTEKEEKLRNGIKTAIGVTVAASAVLTAMPSAHASTMHHGMNAQRAWCGAVAHYFRDPDTRALDNMLTASESVPWVLRVRGVTVMPAMDTAAVYGDARSTDSAPNTLGQYGPA